MACCVFFLLEDPSCCACTVRVWIESRVMHSTPESWASQGTAQVLIWEFALQTHLGAVLQDTHQHKVPRVKVLDRRVYVFEMSFGKAGQPWHSSARCPACPRGCCAALPAQNLRSCPVL